MLPKPLHTYVTISEIAVRQKRLEAAVGWSAVYSIEEISDAVQRLGEEASVEHLTSLLSLGRRRDIQAGFEENYTPAVVRQIQSNLEQYNLLTGGVSL